MKHPLAFISDLHLDRYASDKNQQFIRATTWLGSHVEQLVILGDLWDAWLGDDSMDYPPFEGYRACLEALRQLAKKIPVYFMVGNRDFACGKDFYDRNHLRLIPDPFVWQLPDGRRALLAHGDLLCLADHQHLSTIETLRHPHFIQSFSALPMSVRLSRLSTYMRQDKTIDIDFLHTQKLLADHQCSLIIHGHTHRCAYHPHSANHPFERFVLHNWDEAPGVLIWHEKCLKLARFDFSSSAIFLQFYMPTPLPASQPAKPATAPTVSNFIRQLIDADLQSGKWKKGANPRVLPIITRFPPEPNGYLHIGHAKSIHINFGLAREYGGRCHLRFDDTNPTKEDVEYERAIIEAVRWLGFDWGEHGYYASSYYQTFYDCAVRLIEKGLAYVDSQTAEEIRNHRGTLTAAGVDSPYRHRSVEENLALFARMKQGEFADGAHVLRAKIDMASPNINLRDPTIYRIRHEHHYRTHNDWCIYPMYDYAHCLSDAIEKITHSICTLEFEDHRPLYEWFLNQLTEFFPQPHPQQIEFARLKINYTVTSKRKLLSLVSEGVVSGWDDPRMPTIMGLRRRGFTPESIAKFCEMIGVSKADSTIDMSLLEECLRDDLNARAPRRIAILDPIRLIIENYPADQQEEVQVPHHPQQNAWGYRPLPFSRELWIERSDFQAVPEKGFHRLSPNNEVRLRYGYIVRCHRYECDEKGSVQTVYATYDPQTKSGAGSVNKKVKGNIHWLSTKIAQPATARLIDSLFIDNALDRDEDWLAKINPQSLIEQSIWIEPALAEALPEAHFQFERNGYFCADRYDHRKGRAVFNRIVPLKSNF